MTFFVGSGAIAIAAIFIIGSALLMLCIWWTHKY